MMKKVDFSLDLLKKIVSGEVKGKAIHIDGNNEEGEITKVLDYWNAADHYVVSIYKTDDGENCTQCTIASLTCVSRIQLYIEEPEPELKPFDKVICRDFEDNWDCALHSYSKIFARAGNRFWDEVHPWRDCYAKYLGTDTPWEQIVKETKGIV